MKMPWNSRVQTSAAAPESPPEEREPLSETHSSPGLETIVKGFPRGDGIRVLDLGPAVPENIAFLAGFADKVEVVDALRESLDVRQAVRILQTLVPEHQGTIHLVLLWDFLNYLSPVEGAALVAAIAPLCRPEARCFAMVFTSETMPASPLKYRVADQRHLTYERSSTEVVGSPKMAPVAVERILSGFIIEHAFVLRNGVREYVAMRDAAGTKHSG